MGEKSMTQEEEKRIDEKFEGLKEFFTEKINNLKETIDSFNCITKDQKLEITLVHAIANENKLKITEIEGNINTIKEVKKAENGVKQQGLKVIHLILGISIPTALTIILFIITQILP